MNKIIKLIEFFKSVDRNNLEDIKKEKKITEFINYTNAKNRLFINKYQIK